MSERSLRDVQIEQRPWVARNFGDDRPAYHPLLGAVEELGELAHAHLKHEQKIRGMSQYEFETKAADALGDIVIYLCDYASAMGFDLQDVVLQTWESVKKRDWVADPHLGGALAG